MAEAKTRAMGRALGRRALFKASKISGAMLWAFWELMIMLVPIAVCSVMFSAITSLWREREPTWMSQIAGPMAIAGILGWGLFDTLRADRKKMFEEVEWGRPVKSVAIIALSGFALMVDRMLWALKGISLGIAKPLTGAPQTKSWAGEPTPSTWKGCLEPLTEEIRAGWAWAKLAPAWTMIMAWGIAAIPLGIPLSLLALAEDWAIGAWGKGKQAIAEAPERARATMEELANEGARDLAQEERRDLGKAAEAGKPEPARGPRSGL